MPRWRYVVVTHTDLDGVVAAAVYLKLAGARLGVDSVVQFTEPYKLHKVLRGLKGIYTERIAIMDLGPNVDTIGNVVEAISELRSRGVRIEWYDHHRWQSEWIEEFRRAGAEIYIDTSTCAAGVVAKYATEVLEAGIDDVVRNLVDAACAADLWRWDHPLAPKLYRIVDRFRGGRGDKWRRKLIEGFVEGSLWWPDLDEALHEYLSREFKGYDAALKSVVIVEKNGCRFVAVVKKPGPPNASILANSLLDRYDVDFVVVVRTGGSKGISFRSRNINVREIALRLGGGGHPRAAGAPLRMPVWLSLIARFIPSIKLRYAVKLVERVVGEIGCPKL